MGQLKYRKDIDGLRSLAIIPVVFNHAGIPGFSGGFVGVDIFFVISGFLITGILAREIDEKRYSIVKFYERRARRILPALFTVLLSCLVLGWFLFSPTLYDQLAKSVLAALLFISNFWFWHSAGDYFGPGADLEPLLHTWSLAVEEQFYVFYPLLLWLLSGHSRRMWIVVVGGISLLSLALSAFITISHPAFSFYLLPTRIWELGAGALLALGAYRAFRRNWTRELAGALGLTLISGAIFFLNDQTPFPGLAAIAPVAGASLLIFAGAGSGSIATSLLSLRPFVGVGLISYSFYLWHWPIIVAARVITQTSILQLPVAVFCILSALALSIISLWVIERPFRQNRGQRVISSLGILGLAVTGAVVLAVSASGVIKQNGMIDRFPVDKVAAYERAIKRGKEDKACMGMSDAGMPCHIGAPEASAGPAHVAIWGDSHAGAMLSGFQQWFASKDEAALAFVKSACVPMLGVRRADLPEQHACDAHNAAVMTKILADPNITEVILAGRWALNVEGDRAVHEVGQPAVLAETGKPALGIADNIRLVSKGLEQLVSRLRAHGISVVILAGIPEFGRNVPEMLLTHDIEKSLHGLGPDDKAYMARNKRADAILKKIGDEYGARLIEPAEILCSKDCRLQVEGESLYRDDDHLSKFGARWLVPKLMQSLSGGGSN